VFAALVVAEALASFLNGRTKQLAIAVIAAKIGHGAFLSACLSRTKRSSEEGPGFKWGIKYPAPRRKPGF
jgi:hypothetical protein